MKVKKIASFVFVILCVVLFKNDVYANTEYIVNPDGSGDFVSIQEGVDNVEDGDTLVIYPGVYNEHVEILNKTVNLKGINRDQCIIEYDTYSYEEVPLNISAGEVSNLTIYGRMRDDQTYEMGTLFGEKRYTGYAVHIDSNYEYGKELLFYNCLLVSDNNFTVGIGNRGNNHISFECCELIHTGRCIPFGMHDSIQKEYAGEAKVSFINSRFASTIGDKYFVMWTEGEDNWTEIEINNVDFAVTNLADDYFTEGYGWKERSSKISLEPRSVNFMSTFKLRDYEGDIDNDILEKYNFTVVDI